MRWMLRGGVAYLVEEVLDGCSEWSVLVSTGLMRGVYLEQYCLRCSKVA